LIEEYPRNLEFIAQERYIGSYLEAGSKQILISSARTLMSDIKNRRGKRPAEWSFSIPQKHPLTFKESDSKGLRLQIGISCEIEGTGDDIKKHSILMRVWSYNKDICYRDGLDATEIKDKLECAGWKRVMLRFHIDRRDPNAGYPEPLYHLQVGGDSEDCENCWIPKKINVPRFPYPPMDLILLCEFVLVNFFPRESEDLRKKPEWKSLVRKSQEIFLRNYFESCQKHLNSGTETLLGNSVNLPKGV